VPDSARACRSSALAALGCLVALAGCTHARVDDGYAREDSAVDVVANAALARRIEPDGPIHARSVARDELRAVLAEELDAWKSPAELADYERALVALGLWPADRSLRAEAIAVYAEAIVGIYLPSRRELLLVADANEALGSTPLEAVPGEDIETEFALCHEIIHWLQHQAYPQLMDPDQIPKGSDDLEAATEAALEGDALRFGFDAVGLPVPTPEQWEARIDGQFSDADGSALAQAPALIRLSLGFPYSRGFALAWREEFALLETPPISTEQVMHDERRHEAFLQMDLTQLENRLPPGCRTVQRNTVGELQISILFRDLAADPDPAIWEGWNGDRYLVADCAGQSEWVWWTAWDSARDAEEFAAAYRQLAAAVAARAGSALPVAATTQRTFVVVTSRGLAQEAAQAPPPATRVSDPVTLRALLRSAEERAASE